jgi:hypothetical protein
MKYITIVAFLGLTACEPVPTERPADFDPEFSF